MTDQSVIYIDICADAAITNATMMAGFVGEDDQINSVDSSYLMRDEVSPQGPSMSKKIVGSYDQRFHTTIWGGAAQRTRGLDRD